MLEGLDLKAFRQEHGLSQGDLALILGVGRGKIIDFESGLRRVPRWVGLALAAHSFGIQPWTPDQRTKLAISGSRMKFRVKRQRPRLVIFPES